MSTKSMVRYTAEQLERMAYNMHSFTSKPLDGDVKVALMQAARTEADVAGLVEALKMLIRGYVNTLEGGRDRIVMLGGQCDPLDKLEACDANLRIARNELARWQS